MPRERRKESLRLAVVIVLCAGAASAGAQTYVGNNFASGSSLLAALQTDGNSDQYPPLVILQEYSPSGPATSGAIFNSTGTVNDVTFYGGGNYDFTVYALALAANTTKNELTFSVVGDETFKGDATTTGVQNLAANFSVGAGDYLAFAGVGPWYPQEPNNAVGSDATYASSSEPQTYPTSFTAIPPTTGQTFTVGAHGDAGATYEIVPDPFENQGRSYAIGVTYTPSRRFTAVLPQQRLPWPDELELEQPEQPKQLGQLDRRADGAAADRKGRLCHQPDRYERERPDGDDIRRGDRPEHQQPDHQLERRWPARGARPVRQYANDRLGDPRRDGPRRALADRRGQQRDRRADRRGLRGLRSAGGRAEGGDDRGQ